MKTLIRHKLPIKSVLIGQGLYFVLTGLWPIFSISSFVHLTGPKTDFWLVKTMGLIIFSIGVVLLVGALRKKVAFEVALLSFLSASMFWLIEWFYYFKRVIAPVYFADGFIQLGFAMIWLFYIWFYQHEHEER